MTRKYAGCITVNTAKGTISIDGEEFPWAPTPTPGHWNWPNEGDEQCP